MSGSTEAVWKGEVLAPREGQTEGKSREEKRESIYLQKPSKPRRPLLGSKEHA